MTAHVFIKDTTYGARGGGVPPMEEWKKYQILQYLSMLYWYSGDLERLQRVYCRISTLNE